MSKSTQLTVMLSADKCAEGIRRHALNEHAHKLVQGWYLRHASAAFSKPAGRKAEITATVAVNYANAENPGFDEWLETAVAGFISKRTAYNYMMAAERAGLTLEMDEPAALAAAETALASVAKLSDLYALPKPDGDPEPDPVPGAPSEQAEQLLLPLIGEISRSFVAGSPEEEALYLAPPQVVEDLERQLRTALDMVRAVKADRSSGKAPGRKRGRK